jgi:hypothetical protein
VVVAAFAIEGVVADSAIEGVVVVAAVEEVISGGERIAAENLVGPGEAIDSVVAGAGVQQVGIAIARDMVCAAAGADVLDGVLDVIAFAACAIVGVGVEGDGEVVGAAAVVGGVGAASAIELVSAFAAAGGVKIADEPVVVVAAEDAVVAALAPDRVVALTAIDSVVAATTVQAAVLTIADDRVCAGAAPDVVRAIDVVCFDEVVEGIILSGFGVCRSTTMRLVLSQ